MFAGARLIKCDAAPGHGVLEQLHPVSCARPAGAAEGGAELRGETAAGDYERRGQELDVRSRSSAFPQSRADDVFHRVSLAEAASLGDLHEPQSPDEPIVLHLTRFPMAPGKPRKEQHRIGRADELSTTFETFERNVRDQLGA